MRHARPATAISKPNILNKLQLGRSLAHRTGRGAIMLFQTLRQPSALLAASLLACGAASAHYFYEQFPNSGSPLTPIVQKFDLTALPNGAVPYYIAAPGPSAFAPDDNFPALVSEIRAAADVWNQVSSSGLKLTYGGLLLSSPTASTLSAGPYIVVQFSNSIPHGLLALSGPSALGGLSTAFDGSRFYPIQVSTLRLPADLSNVPGYGPLASYSELMFTTLVHEFGHTLGLQHTLTSSVMSTAVTSGSTRAKPLAADDIAGLSWLYPSGDFLSQTGTVSGTVAFGNGTPVNLAAVTLIAPGLEPVSAFTNPDGTYTIHGVPAGQYLLYAQPLPPAFQGETANDGLIYPVGPDGLTPIPPSPYFSTQFYPGTQFASQASPVAVIGGSITSGISVRVNAEPLPPVYGVRTYGYVPNGVAVPAPPFISGAAGPDTIEASGVGLLSNYQIAAGLTIGVMGSDAAVVSNSARPYQPPYPYLAVDLAVPGTAPAGPGHMLFETASDTYVLPVAFHIVAGPPPVVTAIASYTNRVTAVRGANFNSGTRIFFDGVEAVRRAFTRDGSLIVSAPPAPGGYRANVVALNPDGQSSLFVQASPLVYVYDNANRPTLTVSPLALAPGGDTVVDVFGANTGFEDGFTFVGFGSPATVVKSVVVLTPAHLQVTVTNSGNTTIATAQAISIVNGLQLLQP